MESALQESTEGWRAPALALQALAAEPLGEPVQAESVSTAGQHAELPRVVLKSAAEPLAESVQTAAASTAETLAEPWAWLALAAELHAERAQVRSAGELHAEPEQPALAAEQPAEQASARQVLPAGSSEEAA
jgi:hypothetical protein